jgi:putative Holliday junction resolvase
LVSRILCLDVGERHTGVAVSDPTRTIAQGLATLHHATEAGFLAAVKGLIREHDVGGIVIGLPLSQSGRPSARSEGVRALAERLGKATGLPVTMFDERFSTARADEVLAQAYGGTGRKKSRQQAVDKVAATIILEDYLASLHC